MYDRHEYDKKKASLRWDKYKIDRQAAIDVLGGECYLCASVVDLHFHHVEYHPTESDYPRTGNSFGVRVKRLREAEAHPERFKLLCARCHLILEGVKSQLNKGVDLDKFLSLL